MGALCALNPAARSPSDVPSIFFLIAQLPGGSDPPSSINAGTLPSSSGYAHQHFAQNHVLQEQLRKFWGEMMEEVQRTGTDPVEFKTQQLPLARIKKVRALWVCVNSCGGADFFKLCGGGPSPLPPPSPNSPSNNSHPLFQHTRS